MPGVRIEKHYRLEGGLLAARLSLVNQGTQPDLFVTVSERAVLDEAFRREATLYRRQLFWPAHAGRRDSPARADRLRSNGPWTTGITNGRPSWILALNWKLDQHLASYR